MSEDYEMERSKDELQDALIGHRIVKAESLKVGGYNDGISLTLDNGKTVEVRDTADCCAYTEIYSFLLDPGAVDHMITGVYAEDNYQVWHIFAAMGDVLKLDVGWGEGSGYYSYGFKIKVRDAE